MEEDFDLLSDVLRTMRIRSRLYFRALFGGSFSVDVPGEPGVVRFHIVTRGYCWIGVGENFVLAQPGDVVLVPHGRAHRLASDQASPAVPLEDVFTRAEYRGGPTLEWGPDGDRIELVCGHFGFDDTLPHPFLESLPPLLHCRRDSGGDTSWLDGAVRSMETETSQRYPGWRAVVDRVAEILFVRLLREELEGASGVIRFRAWADPGISRSLGAIHGDPGFGWTLEGLASKASMSRTAFAERFRELLGHPPMTYLKHWRLRRARMELLETSRTLREIAVDLGYGSEASLSRAFLTLYAVTPAAYRREQALR